MSISALLACTSFYSALYLIYFFFAKQQNPLFLFLALGLLIFSCFITPYGYEKRRGNYDKTMSWGQYWAIPLFMWARLFMMPIRLIFRLIYDH